MPERLTDALTYVLSVALAAGVMAFAAYKVMKLNAMEDPPATMGLNFPPAKRKVIIDAAVPAADPLITQSLGAAGSGAEPARGGTMALAGPAQSYELLAVVDGVAFVEVGLARGKMLFPVTVGSVLPGGFHVEAIEWQGGSWRLVAGSLALEQAADASQ